jgi:2-polyprenyl-6-methoxyphenol hydroxylase-like FAD-dependent oxidoreductase
MSLRRPHHIWIVLLLSINLTWSLSTDSAGMSGDSPTRQRPNAIVVGAGLSGLAVSLGLVELGFTVDLVEKKREFGERGATFGLRPNGLKAIAELCGGKSDIVQKLQMIGIPTPQQAGLMLPWGRLRDVLVESVRRNSHQITLHMGMDLCDIKDEVGAECVTANFRPSIQTHQEVEVPVVSYTEPTQSTLTLSGCIVLGCDGVGSSVRQWLQLPPAISTGVNVWRGSITVPADPTHVLTPLLSNGVMPLGMRTYGPYFLVVFNFHSSISNTLAWTVFTKGSSNKDDVLLWSLLEPHIFDDEDRQIVSDLLALSSPADLNRMVTLRTIDPTSTVSSLQTTVTDRAGWGGRGRVTILGDAAHAMRAISGVGGAMAFEDCVVLCRIIQGAIVADAENTNAQNNGNDSGPWFQEYHTVANILQRFEAERLPRVTKIWNREWETAEEAYTTGAQAPFSQEYNDYVNDGV